MAGMFGGCEKSPPPQLETYPVTGLVQFQGQPAKGAEIRLKPLVPLVDPLGRSVEPYGFVDNDGYFTVSTYAKGDGAPPGEYAVTIYWPTVTIEGGEPIYGSDRLQDRYRDPARPLVRLTVVEGSNAVPDINLK
jgi:hypothetical protein